MNDNINKAKDLLIKDGYTCVICKGNATVTSTERGVKPLIGLLDEGTDVSGGFAADKVVGKGAAFLYVLLGVREVFAGVISLPAEQVFKKYGIAYGYDTKVEAIRNRTDTGFCPMESAVKDIDNPAAALTALKKKVAEMGGTR